MAACPPASPRAAVLHSRRAWLAAALAGSAAAATSAAGWWRARQQPEAAALPGGDVCLVAPPTPRDATSGLPLTAARAVPAQARCPVCGMFPARAPEWAAQAIFEQGDAHFFDSPLSLFMYLQDAPRYHPGRAAPAIAAQYVSDSGAGPGAWLDARSAWYVHGSNARGPMRAGNLPAFATQEAAQAFARRRGGRVLGYAEVDRDLIASLAVGSHGSH